MRRFGFLLTIILTCLVSRAQQVTDEPKLEVKPSGRILFDAAYLNPLHQDDEGTTDRLTEMSLPCPVSLLQCT